MTAKRPRKNVTYRNPKEFINALKSAKRELTVLELSWELHCDPQTVRRRIRELIASGAIHERCVGGKERPIRYYSIPQHRELNCPLMEVEG